METFFLLETRKADGHLTSSSWDPNSRRPTMEEDEGRADPAAAKKEEEAERQQVERADSVLGPLLAAHAVSDDGCSGF